MDKKTIGIIATVISGLCCGCVALLSCIWGGMIAANVPFTITTNGEQSVQTFPPTIGYVLHRSRLLHAPQETRSSHNQRTNSARFLIYNTTKILRVFSPEDFCF
jgi:hypothetical protein